MANESAKLRIVGQDDTKAAVESVKRGLKSIDQSAKSTARGVNTALGVFAGQSLKALFRNVLDATAQSERGSRGFAQALKEVKDSAHDLMAAKGGLPEATQSLKDLSSILKDPGLVSAVDTVTSAMIRGFAATAKSVGEIVAGLKLIATGQGGNAAVDMDSKLTRLQAERASLMGSTKGNPLGPQLEQLKELDRAIAAAQTGYDRLISGSGSKGEGGSRGAAKSGFKLGTGKAYIDPAQTKKDAEEAKKFAAELDKSMADIDKSWDDLAKNQVAGTEEYLDDLRKLREEHAAKEKSTVKSEFFDMSEYAKEAARSSQQALSDFLFDPFENGLKGMVKGFADAIRRMIADAAAAKILGDTSQGGLGFGSLITSGVGKLAGFASGGSFMVGGRSGVDANVVAFRATKGEQVTVDAPGQSRGGIVFNMPIDARGATQDAVKMLPGVIREAVTQAVSIMDQRINGGAYG